MTGLEAIFPDWTTFLGACLVLAAAQMVYVLFGFGAGMIAVGSLAVFMPDVRDVIVLMLLINLPAELTVVLGSRRHVSWRGVLLVCIGIAIGVPLGTWILRLGQPTFILDLLGAFLLLVGLAFLLLPRRRAIGWPGWAAPPVGFLSGILGGMFGTGGPPLILYYQLSGLPKTAFRGQLMAIFLLVTVVRVPSYAVAGLITGPRLLAGLAAMPAVLLGAWLGHRLHVRVSEPVFQRLVSVALVGIGIELLLGR
jgi:uncharacterized membrane protein YfcA